MFIISTQYKDLSTSFISAEQSWQGSVLVYNLKSMWRITWLINIQPKNSQWKTGTLNSIIFGPLYLTLHHTILANYLHKSGTKLKLKEKRQAGHQLPTECHSWVGSTPILYTDGPSFKPQPKDWLSWLRI
jgi:hypothetical protein